MVDNLSADGFLRPDSFRLRCVLVSSEFSFTMSRRTTPRNPSFGKHLVCWCATRDRLDSQGKSVRFSERIREYDRIVPVPLNQDYRSFNPTIQ